VSWTTVGSQTVTLAEPFYVGLALTSATPKERARATFDGVALTAATAPATSPSNVPPTISLASPGDGDRYPSPASVAIAANAADSDGTVARVDFYVGAALVGSDATSPYAVTWGTATAGSNVLKAVPTDDRGATTTSATRTIVVNTNTAPAVSLTSPTSGATFTGPATISLTATASDTDGTVTQVDFYSGTTPIGTALTSPYAFTWQNVPVGAYGLTAVARDNQGGMTVSSTRDITVTSSQTLSKAVFTPASIHDVVERYVLEIFTAGSDPNVAQPVATQDLGVPAIVNNECSADVRSTISTLAPGTYIAAVSAISAMEGTLRSDPSSAFTR
jgi:hypothetical protein